jgi:hypothetical protein
MKESELGGLASSEVSEPIHETGKEETIEMAAVSCSEEGHYHTQFRPP